MHLNGLFSIAYCQLFELIEYIILDKLLVHLLL